MQTKDFKGQDLRGRSFKNQDLTGADFFGCDLRGVDFSFANLQKASFFGANLTRAKFNNAKFGRRYLHEFIFEFIGILGSIATALVIIFLVKTIEFYFKNIKIFTISNFDTNLALLLIIYMVFFCTIIYLSTKNIDFIFIVCASILFSVILQLLVSYVNNTKEISNSLMFITLAFIIIMILIGVVISAFITNIFSLACSIFISSSVIYRDNFYSLTVYSEQIIAVSLFMLLSFYVGNTTKNEDNKKFLFLYYVRRFFNSITGTNFSYSILDETDFSYSIFKSE